MAKQKLVMIGNGMAGLRTIEEILERSQSQFDITIIGKEPCLLYTSPSPRDS